MDDNTKHTDVHNLEDSIDQLTDENQHYFIGVLEALNFAQNTQEIPNIKPKVIQQEIIGK